MSVTQPVTVPPTLGALLLRSTLDPPLRFFHLRCVLSSLICPSCSEVPPLPTRRLGCLEAPSSRLSHDSKEDDTRCGARPFLPASYPYASYRQLTDQITLILPVQMACFLKIPMGHSPIYLLASASLPRSTAFLPSRPSLSFVSQRLWWSVRAPIPGQTCM